MYSHLKEEETTSSNYDKLRLSKSFANCLRSNPFFKSNHQKMQMSWLPFIKVPPKKNIFYKKRCLPVRHQNPQSNQPTNKHRTGWTNNSTSAFGWCSSAWFRVLSVSAIRDYRSKGSCNLLEAEEKLRTIMEKSTFFAQEIAGRRIKGLLTISFP